MNIKRYTILATLIIFIIIASSIARSQILGGAKIYNLTVTDQLLSGIIAQSTVSTGGKVILPLYQKDFTLLRVSYFDNNTWVVAKIVPLNNSVTEAYVILQFKNGMYHVVLGPGTAFDNSYVQSMPADLGQYLGHKGIFYETTLQ
jgi:hypothetical protein